MISPIYDNRCLPWRVNLLVALSVQTTPGYQYAREHSQVVYYAGNFFYTFVSLPLTERNQEIEAVEKHGVLRRSKEIPRRHMALEWYCCVQICSYINVYLTYKSTVLCHVSRK